MTAVPDHVVVVGAGLGGLRTVERLRSDGYAGRVTLVGAESHPPYDRPPLSKQVLDGSWEQDRTVLCDLDGLADLGVTARLGCRAVAREGTGVRLDDGGWVTGDTVVLATGAVARRLPRQPQGVAVLRDREDALALREAFGTARSMTVIGAGLIGAEAAWAARRRGIAVTVLEQLAVPCARVLGTEGGTLLARLFEEAGVDLRCGVGVGALKDRHTVELTDGGTVSSEIVLVAIGAVPDLSWLAGSVPLAGGGIACDTTGRVLDTPGVWAVGDAAAWADPATGRHRREEHWTSAVEQAGRVACGILGTAPPVSGPSYVWSDQFGLKVQLLGRPDPAAEVVALHGKGTAGGPVRGTVLGYFTAGRLTAVASFGAPARFVRYRPLIAAGADREAVLAQPDGGGAGPPAKPEGSGETPLPST
ncbi:FAD-dependent oxidoreductase [Streptomyces sp. NPDC048106]|uniref:NAD(P)/FAD-dependent oxidoreductase n=1 Tax=Streptomyces sp. NPDC048106 TaxID=3155750 RepID=UPI0034536C9B